jgi:hypothetical protein
VVRLDAFFRSVVKELFQPLMLEALDHSLSVTH